MSATSDVAESNAAQSADTATDVMIEARGLSKFYGEFAATQDVSFSVKRGEICAFLGPNGAGKSTTMKMLTGFLAPNRGESYLAGINVATDRIKASEKLGYLPENGPLYTEMTPEGMLRYIGEVRGVSGSKLSDRLAWVADKCSLTEVWRKPISKLSRGFRQRVGMAHAMLHDPEVLILDEPTSGLDPNQVHGVRELITELAKTKTILLSTHILQEVRAVCPRVVLINNGRIVFDGPTTDLGSSEVEMEEKFRSLTSAA
ncbi:ABC transporter ATP-binding protein [Fuerstiella marisgermanici]|uniref:Putative ABC transporter ATP-binding protein YbhF n=1 Tax=Fuerstiella marisgermanici TaxID=1891926 RepID=A0A1P8WMI8_9PLAN|nr:ATP-binding cassette domain-containing protein [Fuerstiella marisgermanici]APZ95247.1 putative ABC transporter ATP-binding protein YbhF [Fuerstiella marisgermanici]